MKRKKHIIHLWAEISTAILLGIILASGFIAWLFSTCKGTDCIIYVVAFLAFIGTMKREERLERRWKL